MNRFLSIALCCAVLTACDRAGPDYTLVQDILTTPTKYEGREVNVRGTARAVTSLPFVDLRGFLVEQGGVDLLVLTPGRLPAEGETVAVRGIVESAAILNGQALGLRIRETERL
jgi:hypothetical protein